MKIPPRLTIPVITMLLGLPACGFFNGGTTKTLFLDHYRIECTGVGLRLCLLDRESTDDPWQARYSGIEGFTYEWGYTYELLVRETKVRNPPADASSIRTELIEVIEKERVPPDVHFQIALSTVAGEDGRPVIVERAAGLYEFHFTEEFTCAVSVCAEIDAAMTAGHQVLLEFHHPEEPADPLVAVRLVCADTPERFWESCS